MQEKNKCLTKIYQYLRDTPCCLYPPIFAVVSFEVWTSPQRCGEFVNARIFLRLLAGSRS